MRVLIVDEHADFRLALAEYLRAGHDAAAAKAVRRGAVAPAPIVVREWDPALRGLPTLSDDHVFDCDVILLDSSLGAHDAVVWLAALTLSSRRLPPVVMLTSGRDAADLLVNAVKVGVVGTVARIDLAPGRLYAQLADAVLERQRQVTIQTSLRTGVYSVADLPPADPGTAAELPAITGYVLDRMIGQGGTARVYLARRATDGLQIVLKVLLPELAGETPVVARFMQEFSLVQKIQSAYVTRIFDLNYDRGTAYLAMEYFGAGDLNERLKAGLRPIEAVKVFAQIARALDAIRTAGIVHRDMKPHNVMFRDRHHLAIVDFGGAKVLGEVSGITRVGQVVGTPNYMSPEQILGQALDARSDLYSLGVILHQLLTGRPLYHARDTAELMDMHVNSPVPVLPPRVSGFQPLLARLVAKKREDRFASARDLYAYVAA